MGRKRIHDDAEAYEIHKGKARERILRMSAAGRDIGPLREVADPGRKDACRGDLPRFCRTYLSQRFALPWALDHIKALGVLQACALRGGQFALAMPRGQGKTTLCEATALWALLYAHRRFVVVVGATAEAAGEVLNGIKSALETNDRLADDFPEICQPIWALEGSPLRCHGQTLGGVRTRITWKGNEVVLPTVEGAHTSGAVLSVAGISGRIRGFSHVTAGGERIRPDLVILDDPSTDESARSPSQNHKRIRIVQGAVKGLAGPGQSIAIVMPCTVVAPGDLADQFLDRTRFPAWQGQRTKLLLSWPERMDLWEAYREVRRGGMASDDKGGAGTAFYKTHRAEMDKGAVVSWPQRYEPEQLSGIQYAMDLWIDDPSSFYAEYQNEPQAEGGAGDDLPELEDGALLARLSSLPRGTVPREATRLTVGIDVQGKVLYWLAVGWEEGYGGEIVDYGCWPRQNRAFFTARDARPELSDVFPHLAGEALFYAGLRALLDELIGREWARDDGHSAVLDRVGVDANWGKTTDVVYRVCREHAHRALLVPCHGRYFSPLRAPISEWKRQPGEQIGREWRYSAPTSKRGRHLLYDTNAWKSFLADRLLTPPGSPGCLLLPGGRPADHHLLVDHLTSEYRQRTPGRGREVDEWLIRPDRSENHWFDCAVMAAVLASLAGLRWSPGVSAGVASAEEPPSQRPKRSLAELQRQKRAEREARRAGR